MMIRLPITFTNIVGSSMLCTFVERSSTLVQRRWLRLEGTKDGTDLVKVVDQTKGS